MYRTRILIRLILLQLVMALPASASESTAPNKSDAIFVIRQNDLRRDVGFLSDEICEGRSSTQTGAVKAAMWLELRYSSLGLVPFNGHYGWGFTAEGHVCHNVVGMIPTDRDYDDGKYVVIGAHFDNLGILDGQLYPGADSNASGVAAMLGVADMFRHIRSSGQPLTKNIIFVAFDAKQLSLAGSQAFFDSIENGLLKDPFSQKTIGRDDISLMVNLDILGGTSSPVHTGRPDYMIMLGGDEVQTQLLRITNYRQEVSLDLGYDYYGSEGFTNMFLNRVSDQKAFLEHGIKSVMFTSGITMDTNRVTDTPDRIDISVLKRRVCLICRWLEKILLLDNFN